MANLILWRHAEAEVESNTGQDTDRALTKRGRKDALKMAKWLQQHLPVNTQVLCSPARRCLETVAALQCVNTANDRRKARLEVSVVDFLSIENGFDEMYQKLVNDDSSKTILIVGHQPSLGLLIVRLLGIDEATCVVKKGAVWWLRQRLVNGALQTYLYTVQLPHY